MIVVSMMVRNEAGRHLDRALRSAMDVAQAGDGLVVVTDDASDDDTAQVCADAGAVVFENGVPEFWEHEGRARQRHYERTSQYCNPGDWVLSLDADETINDPQRLVAAVEQAKTRGARRVAFPLYEFWDESRYRVDGFWFGTKCGRLYAWQKSGPGIAQKEMGCGSEPEYTKNAPMIVVDELHLLHWGYSREVDRVAKHARYTSRLNGHGHNDRHVQSIVTTPVLREYGVSTA